MSIDYTRRKGKEKKEGIIKKERIFRKTGGGPMARPYDVSACGRTFRINSSYLTSTALPLMT